MKKNNLLKENEISLITNTVIEEFLNHEMNGELKLRLAGHSAESRYEFVVNDPTSHWKFTSFLIIQIGMMVFHSDEITAQISANRKNKQNDKLWKSQEY